MTVLNTLKPGLDEKLYERAREPKKLVVLPITHYEIYAGKWLEESSRLACDWFARFL